MTKQINLPFDPPLQETMEEFKERAKSVFFTLSQDKNWMDERGRLWELTDMASSHLENLRGYLLKQAEHLMLYYGFGEIWCTPGWVLEGMEKHDINFKIEEFSDAREWLLQTVLILRIEDILERRHRGVSFGEVVGG